MFTVRKREGGVSHAKTTVAQSRPDIYCFHFISRQKLIVFHYYFLQLGLIYLD